MPSPQDKPDNPEIHRTITWRSLAWPSSVTHSSVVSVNGRQEHGRAVGHTDQAQAFDYDYSLALTPSWELQSVSIADNLHDERKIALRVQDDNWYDTFTNKQLPAFNNVSFIDISVSPFTNSLPIHRLQFHDDIPQQIDVIYFDENTFSLRKVQQLYSKIDAHTYRYQDVEQPDFTALLRVDHDGIVIDYEHLFQRI